MDKRKRIFAYCSFVCLNFGVAQVYAADFYTIIGPDGRPMIVQQKETKSTQKESPRTKKTDQAYSTIDEKKQVQVIESKENAEEKNPTNSAQKLESKNVSKSQILSNPALLTPKESITQSQVDKNKRAEKSIPNKIDGVEHSQVKTGKMNQEKTNTSTVVKGSMKISDHQPNHTTQQDTKDKQSEMNSKKENTKNVSSPSINKDAEKVRDQGASSNITIVDGVEYVDNEYLEDREFNLEGKKRFYIMPDSSVGGTRRFETVEREKGISKSVFSKFTKNTQAENEPVVLASTYYRLPKNELVQSLEQSCFSGKKINKAKLLSLDKNEMGLWPVPPIKEKFVYDVIKLDSPIENIHFTSYASSQKSPSYYWPLVVFLDQQGCVIEGVIGFKNENIDSTYASYSALEGVLQKPPNAVYLFMTPLLEAVDVQDVQLTNKGQIKLSVLR